MKARELKQDKKNYRKHGDRNRSLIKKSVEECGLGRSVLVDADGVLIAGNGVASVIDPNTPVKVVEPDGTELVVVKRTDLREGDQRRKVLALADNATSDDVEWDMEMLHDDGWEEDDLAEWGVEDCEEEAVETKEAQEDDFDEDFDEVETVCKAGDIWQLGQHRLMCGDSTDAGSVALLMDGEKADLSFLDPPYDFTSDSYFDVAVSYMKQNSEVFLMTNERYLSRIIVKHDELFSRMFAVDFRLAHLIANCCPMSRVDFIGEFKIGKTNDLFNNLRDGFSTLIECAKFHRADIEKTLGHTQSKNPALPGKFIEHYTQENNSVIDLFGGSGSTMIACEQLNRKCYMMELDEHYCDVIIARWEKLTGKQAVKVCNVNESNSVPSAEVPPSQYDESGGSF